MHPEQQFFAYASVATDEIEAKEFVENLIKKYGIQNGELKGSKLIKFSKGRKAIDEILKRFDGRYNISISNKKYALACKFYEYIFEPCLSEINSLFYGTDFHKFIANILYVEFLAQGAGAESIFAEFEELMREKNESMLSHLFASSAHPKNSLIITQIREFAQHKSDNIREELASLEGTGTGKWILDLTNTALYTLLAHWGTKYDELTAICDPSKPLDHQSEQSIFQSMIGRKDRLYSEMFGEKQPITFNLSGPIQFANSKIAHGIQLADAIAAASIYIFTNNDDGHCNEWKKLIYPHLNYGSVIPDFDYIDLNKPSARRNALILMELHRRAKKNINLTEGMAKYVQFISQAPVRIR